ncbi:MAG TPA: PQQ-binding-like beta-propeller repeat protein [Chthoniobacteraceae bacterium]|nr:PQQ-binding-like beta-propeller repeat protein [Chthoniobacteraceae bacterium]
MPPRALQSFALRLLCLSVCAAESAAGDDGWPTLHHDAERTGRTEHSPGVPFEHVWHRFYWDELIAPEAEPIVAEHTLFFGTFKGLLRALHADTGEEIWKADLGAPIHHAPAYNAGRVFAATMGGQVVALEAATGKELWRFTAPRRGGFAASPAISAGRVFLGDRAGFLYALDAASGKPAWSADLGAPILQTVAIKDGKLAVAAEDLVPRLFDAATGRPLWQGAQMNGATVRGYYPVFWKDLVIWRTENHSIERYTNDVIEATEEGRLYRETRQKFKWTREAEEIIKTLPGRYTDAKYEQEQSYIRRQMIDGKHPRSFYALKVADGSEPTIYGVGYHSSENGYSVPASSPIDRDGNLYVFTKSVYSQWPYPIRAFDAISTLDYGTGLPVLIRDIDRAKGSFPATCDESNNLTLAGDKLFDTHDHVLAYMDLKTRKVYHAFSSHAPELWGGVAKCIASDNVAKIKPGQWHLDDDQSSLHFSTQWNGPTQGAVAIVEDKIWWITGSSIVCLKGTVAP